MVISIICLQRLGAKPHHQGSAPEPPLGDLMGDFCPQSQVCPPPKQISGYASVVCMYLSVQ